MIIQPTVCDLRTGRPTLYESGPVYTQVGNRIVPVSAGYIATTVAEVIRRAYLNAMVRQMSIGLVQRISF